LAQAVRPPPPPRSITARGKAAPRDMAAKGSKFISGRPSALVVKARRQLKTEEEATQFNSDLLEILEANAAPETAFEDFDVSQNPISAEQFDSLFSALSTANVRVERMRLFGCPTLDDSVVLLLAGWFSTVTPETVPLELHLSDCAITTEGFNSLMDAIEFNEAFPYKHPSSGQPSLLYLRLENNYIEESAIQQRVDSGMMIAFKKNSRPTKPPAEAKIKLLVMDYGKFQQKAGPPPAPEDAPPPKEVFDKSSGQWGQGKKGGWQSQGSWQYTGGWKPATAAIGDARPAQKGGGGGGGAAPWQKGRSQAPMATQSTTVRPAPWQQNKGWQQNAAAAPQATTGRPYSKGTSNGKGAASGVQAGKGKNAGGGLQTAQRVADRSRTPPPVQQPAKPPPGKVPLPAPWEQHFSDEYGIPYYWNSKTGAAVWERPTR